MASVVRLLLFVFHAYYESYIIQHITVCKSISGTGHERCSVIQYLARTPSLRFVVDLLMNKSITSCTTCQDVVDFLFAFDLMGSCCTVCCKFAVDFRRVVNLLYIMLCNKSTTNRSKWSLGLCLGALYS